MKFASVEELGAWARAYAVSRVAFHADGTLSEAEFAASVSPDDNAMPKRPALDRAMRKLMGAPDDE